MVVIVKREGSHYSLSSPPRKEQTMKKRMHRQSMRYLQERRCSRRARSNVITLLLFFNLCNNLCDAQRLITTTELAEAPAPDGGPTFLFLPFPMLENLTTSSSNPPYCIWPPTLSLPPPYVQAPPPPPFYFTPINPPPVSVPSPPEATIPNAPYANPPPPPQTILPNPPYTTPPPPPQTLPNPPPTLYFPNPPTTVPNPPSGSTPNPPVTIPSPPSSQYPPVFLPPVVYPPPSAPPPPPPRGSQQGLWCVAKPSVPDPIIQEAMDYACGSGADCALIQDAGPCFSPNTLVNHASFAFNSYWQRTKVAGGTCDFGGVATIITVDPSYDGCHFLYN